MLLPLRTISPDEILCANESAMAPTRGRDDGVRDLLTDYGARGGNRTRTAVRLRDFKSLASTCFATRAAAEAAAGNASNSSL
jgi:hypothetical protein